MRIYNALDGDKTLWGEIKQREGGERWRGRIAFLHRGITQASLYLSRDVDSEQQVPEEGSHLAYVRTARKPLQPEQSEQGSGSGVGEQKMRSEKFDVGPGGTDHKQPVWFWSSWRPRVEEGLDMAQVLKGSQLK